MSLQESNFVTSIQRFLDCPLDVRFHYGHPDIFDKVEKGHGGKGSGGGGGGDDDDSSAGIGWVG